MRKNTKVVTQSKVLGGRLSSRRPRSKTPNKLHHGKRSYLLSDCTVGQLSAYGATFPPPKKIFVLTCKMGRTLSDDDGKRRFEIRSVVTKDIDDKRYDERKADVVGHARIVECVQQLEASTVA